MARMLKYMMFSPLAADHGCTTEIRAYTFQWGQAAFGCYLLECMFGEYGMRFSPWSVSRPSYIYLVQCPSFHLVLMSNDLRCPSCGFFEIFQYLQVAGLGERGRSLDEASPPQTLSSSELQPRPTART